MKIGIVSDTHGNLKAFLHVIETIFQDCDIIIHAGDILYGADRSTSSAFNAAINSINTPFLAAEGNCDRFSGRIKPQIPLFSPYGKITVAGKKFIFTHGDLYTTDLSKKLCAKENEADFFISGHTHTPVFFYDEGIVYLNPGSASKPRGHIRVPTVMVLTDYKVQLIHAENNEILEQYQIPSSHQH